MPRAKTGVKRRRRHKKILKQAEGYYGGRHRLFRTAKEALDRAGVYAYKHRKTRKRELRALWQTRIAAALQQAQGTALQVGGLSYSRFSHQLKVKGIGLNRKMLAELAVREPQDFDKLVAHVQS